VLNAPHAVVCAAVLDFGVAQFIRRPGDRRALSLNGGDTVTAEIAGAVVSFETVTAITEAVVRFLAASRASAVSVWLPS
jgi:hypothetical protein